MHSPSPTDTTRPMALTMPSLDEVDDATSFPSVPSSQFSFLQDGTNHIISDSDYARKCKRIMQGYQDLLRLG